MLNIFIADFGVSQLFIHRFSNVFQQCDKDLIGFHVICCLNVSVKYFFSVAAKNMVGE